MLNAGLGLWHQRLSWQDVEDVRGDVLSALGEYLENHVANIRAGLGLVLWSPDRGTGKTLLAVLATKTLLAGGVDCYFTQFSEMIDTFSAGWRDEAERAWFNRRIRNAQMLVIDDLGREHKGRSEVVESMLDQVIRHRVANALPTLMTTNYSPQEIQGGYGPNVMSLLYERSLWVEVPGRDYRSRSNERARLEIQQGLIRPITVG
jgi:DNA replication protein DnaC